MQKALGRHSPLWVASPRPRALTMVFSWRGHRGQDAHDTQGRDALATAEPSPKGRALDDATHWLANPTGLCCTIRDEDAQSHNTIRQGPRRSPDESEPPLGKEPKRGRERGTAPSPPQVGPRLPAAENNTLRRSAGLSDGRGPLRRGLVKRHEQFRVGDPQGEVGLAGIGPLDHDQEGFVEYEILESGSLDHY